MATASDAPGYLNAHSYTTKQHLVPATPVNAEWNRWQQQQQQQQQPPPPPQRQQRRQRRRQQQQQPDGDEESDDSDDEPEDQEDQEDHDEQDTMTDPTPSPKKTRSAYVEDVVDEDEDNDNPVKLLPRRARMAQRTMQQQAITEHQSMQQQAMEIMQQPAQPEGDGNHDDQEDGDEDKESDDCDDENGQDDDEGSDDQQGPDNEQDSDDEQGSNDDQGSDEEDNYDDNNVNIPPDMAPINVDPNGNLVRDLPLALSRIYFGGWSVKAMYSEDHQFLAKNGIQVSQLQMDEPPRISPKQIDVLMQQALRSAQNIVGTLPARCFVVTHIPPRVKRC